MGAGTRGSKRRVYDSTTHSRTNWRFDDGYFTKALAGVIFVKHRSRNLGERRKAFTEVAGDISVSDVVPFFISLYSY